MELFANCNIDIVVPYSVPRDGSCKQQWYHGLGNTATALIDNSVSHISAITSNLASVCSDGANADRKDNDTLAQQPFKQGNALITRYRNAQLNGDPFLLNMALLFARIPLPANLFHLVKEPVFKLK